MPFFNQQQYLDPHRSEINLEAEESYPIFRFKDLKDDAQYKFSGWLKDKSSIKTLRERAKETDILRVLKDLNPIIIRPGWQEGFSHSTLFRYWEQPVSSMVFNSLFRRRPNNVQSWRVRYHLVTPSPALDKHNNEFHCLMCDSSFPMEFRSQDHDLCRSCHRDVQDSKEAFRQQTQTYAKYNQPDTYKMPFLPQRNRPFGLQSIGRAIRNGIRHLQSKRG